MFNENDFFREATLRICGHLDIETAMSSCLRCLAPNMKRNYNYDCSILCQPYNRSKRFGYAIF